MRSLQTLRPLVSLAILCALAGASRSAVALGGDGWPALAHDGRRSGRSTGTGAMAGVPAVAWKRPMGGALGEAQVVTHDIDGDGAREVILVSAGKVVARRADDSTVWASPDIGALRVIGAFDLDGQSGPEVIAVGASPPGVSVLSSAGALLWQATTATTAIDALVAPNGAGSRLFVAEQLGALTAYQFTGGIQSPAQNQEWLNLLSPWSVDMAAADVDGDGTLDLVRGRDNGFMAIDTATGMVKCEAGNIVSGFGAPMYFPAFGTADVDKDGRAEVVLYDYSYYYSEDASVFVTSCNGAGMFLTPQVRWSEKLVADVTPGSGNDINGKQIVYVADGVTDLDGQGNLEIVYSVWDGAAATWTTKVRDAATGAVLATRTGEVLEEVADLDGDGKPEALLREATGMGSLPKPFFSDMRLYDFDSGALTDKGWVLPEGRAARISGRRTARVTGGAGEIGARQDSNADGSNEAYIFLKDVMVDPTDPRPGKLVTVHGPDGVILKEYKFPKYIHGSVLDLAAGVSAAATPTEALVMLTDGGLRLLDKDLLEEASLHPGNHARFVTAAATGGSKNTIFGVDSADFLVALDGTQLDSGLPVLRWSSPDAIQPESRGYVNAPALVIPDAAGAAARIVARAHVKNAYEEQALAGFDANGAPLWSVPVGAGRTVAGFDNFEVLDDLDGDSVRDFFLTELDAAGVQQMVVRRGSDGEVMAQRPTSDLFPPAGVYMQGHAAVDVNGDGKLDIVSALHGSWFIGMDVSQAAGGDPATAFTQIFRATAGPNGQAMAAELDGDPQIDLVRANSQNAFSPYERRDLQGNVEVGYAAPHPNVAGTDANTAAFIARPGAAGSFDLVWSGMTGDALGAVAKLDGVTFGESWFVYLAGGVLYSKAQKPANRSSLSSPIVLDLDGDGDEEVIVGSNDGTLYALAGQDGALAWSLSLGSPIAHTLAADVDKDDKVELLCVLGDGTLVALDTPGDYTFDDVTPGGAGGSGGTGGAGGMGGMGGVGGVGGGGAGGATGGVGGSGAAAGSGGTTATGGQSTGATAGSGGAGPGSDAGCGCRTADSRTAISSFSWLTALAVLGFGLRRRSRRPAPLSRR